MEIIVLLMLSFGTFILVSKLVKITKLESQILYLIFGIILGLILRKTHYGTIQNLFPHIGNYNSIALLFMFFIAGFSINISQLKKSGKITAKLFSIPAYIETIIISITIYLLLKIYPSTSLQLQYIEALICAAIFALASPANTISICANLIKTGYTDKNNIPATMIVASIIDGFITIPVVFVATSILLTADNQTFNASKIIIMIITILLAILIAFLIGLVIGRIVLILTKTIFKKMNDKNQPEYINYTLTILTFLFALAIIYLLQSIDSISRIMKLFSILIMCAVGLSINNFDHSGASKIIADAGNRIFTQFGAPLIFIYVGAIIDLKVLLNPSILTILVIITLLAILIKTSVTKFILRGTKYTKGERKFAALCYVPKGVGLINFSVLFQAILGSESNLIPFMSMLATVSILITMTIGISSLNKAKNKLLFKSKTSKV